MKWTHNPLLTRKSLPYTIFYYLSPYILLIVFVVLWHLVANTGKTLLPTPYETLERLFTVWTGTIAKQPMLYHVWMSMRRILTALVISIFVGVPFGVAMGWNKIFCAICKPLFEIIRPVPPIAWVPLFTLWFGTGEISRVMIIIMGVLMPIVVNAYTGVRMVPQLNFDVGKAFGASSLNLLFDVVLPSSLAAIFAGIRTAVGGGWMVVLAAEMLAAKSGIGYLIMQGSNANDLELAIVGMFMIGVLGAGCAYGFDFLERGLCPWKQK